MKKLALVSLIVSSLVLSACSSGGSGTAKTPDGDKVNLELSPEGAVVGKTSGMIL